VSPLVVEHGVGSGQAVASTEVQEQNTARFRSEAVPPSPPGSSVVGHVGVEASRRTQEVAGQDPRCWSLLGLAPVPLVRAR